VKLVQTRIPDVVIVEPTAFEDDRGWFLESFNERHFQEELKRLGLAIPSPFIQDNHSCSKRGVLRGLHYQLPPYAQGKLVRVVSGAAFDVAVDIRIGSQTFGEWMGVELTAKNKRILWIPEGFAHGFIALEDNTNFLYKTTNYYARDYEAAIRWDDPELGIDWPEVGQTLISQKDMCADSFSAAKKFSV
jgi:dTDP-4-dehydrorhamnose 3,5-epimerase